MSAAASCGAISRPIPFAPPVTIAALPPKPPPSRCSFLRARLVPTYHEDGAVSVTHHRVGDASHKRPSYSTEPSAAQYDHTCVEFLAYPHNFFVGSSRPEVCLGYLPAFRTDPFRLLVEERPGIPLSLLKKRLPSIARITM